ncbi:Uu.00g073270.m01.CDS01 [Anthostomella pinea]|uniref:Uu.00g073270.m01.CDS01 n=1 Tax=Anthostomella pinea TaxID=933095 RepID=A0AAI8YLJ0_9PEZI|nr:Uu.00g073270.m01.CDS01 [Anthostomella pinea]
MAGFSGKGGSEGGRNQKFDIKAYHGAKSWAGHVSKALALAYPDFTVTMQDRPEAISAAAKLSGLPRNLSFKPHDFFSPQTLHGADAYFLRHILHNWPQAEAVSILSALVPALKPGARVLVSEFLMPGAAQRGRSLLDDKLIRQIDLQMMDVYNSKERTAEDFAALFRMAGEKLRFVAKYQLPGDQESCIFEAVYDDDDGAP